MTTANSTLLRRVIVLERVTTITPLGIRFWDPATDSQVSQPLRVAAYHHQWRDRPVFASATRSGLYVLSDLPGLHAFEHPSATAPSIPDESIRYYVAIVDPGGIYLPMILTIDLPLPYRGIYPVDPSTATEDDPPGTYLFSAPARPVQPGVATIYAHLVRDNTTEPAAFAVVEVTHNGTTWYGIADKNGSVAIMFPYPLFTLSSFGGQGLTAQTWPLSIKVRYQPSKVSFPLAPLLPDIPDLGSLMLQNYGDIWETSTGPTAETRVETLRFGQALVVTTQSPQQTARLGISPATS